MLRRYTRNARVDVPYDRHDHMHVGPDGTIAMYRHTTLLIEAMGVVRSGCKSSLAYDRAMEVLKALRMQLDIVPNGIGPVVDETAEPNEANDDINPSAPTLSQTKGHKRGDNEPEQSSASVRKKMMRVCSICGLKADHNSDTCRTLPQNKG